MDFLDLIWISALLIRVYFEVFLCEWSSGYGQVIDSSITDGPVVDGHPWLSQRFHNFIFIILIWIWFVLYFYVRWPCLLNMSRPLASSLQHQCPSWFYIFILVSWPFWYWLLYSDRFLPTIPAIRFIQWVANFWALWWYHQVIFRGSWRAWVILRFGWWG